MTVKTENVFSYALMRDALFDSLRKLNPRKLWRNPVMLTVEVGSAITTVKFFINLIWGGREPAWFIGLTAFWLWLTVIFSTFAESLAEGRGKARAESIRKTRADTKAKKLAGPEPGGKYEVVSSERLKKGDYVLLDANDLIPSDGEVVSGAALVNEAAVTGESAPVVRESGGDRSAVTGGTLVIAGSIVIRITADHGETFLDKLIAMVESAKRRKTPNEIALEVLLVALTVVFILVTLNLSALSFYSVKAAGTGHAVSLTALVALFVCLAPTTIAALLPAIGIAGMDRLFHSNVVALSGRAIEAAGDVNVLLLDKTGTITLGNREASEFIPVEGVSVAELADVALMASLTDETPEGRSIVVLAKREHNLRVRELPANAQAVQFSAETRMSGIRLVGAIHESPLQAHSYMKGASDAVLNYIKKEGGVVPPDLDGKVMGIASGGGTPLVVTRDSQIMGVVALNDVLKGGIRERFEKLHSMGIKTVMITGDNPLTAAAIASEAGVTDFLAQARPEDKLRLIRDYQNQGYMVAMTGDGTNDAPALAQADVAVAMHTGTQAAREAANIIDLDSNPTKLLDIVETGKQILMTRGVLTTFSIANDVAKYFAIIPAALSSIYPQLAVLNVMGLKNPFTAILSAVIFNAIVIPLLVPLALRGARYKPMPAQKLLVNNLLLYGGGGMLFPFIGIKLIDMLIGLFA